MWYAADLFLFIFVSFGSTRIFRLAMITLGMTLKSVCAQHTLKDTRPLNPGKTKFNATGWLQYEQGFVARNQAGEHAGAYLSKKTECEKTPFFIYSICTSICTSIFHILISMAYKTRNNLLSY